MRRNGKDDCPFLNYFVSSPTVEIVDKCVSQKKVIDSTGFEKVAIVCRIEPICQFFFFILVHTTLWGSSSDALAVGISE